MPNDAAERLRETRGAVLLRLEHEAWCEYRVTGDCGCAAGMAFLDALAADRAAERRATVERIRVALDARNRKYGVQYQDFVMLTRIDNVLNAEADHD